MLSKLCSFRPKEFALLGLAVAGTIFAVYRVTRHLRRSTAQPRPCFDVLAFERRLATNALGRTIQHHVSCPTTMTIAALLLDTRGAGAHGTVILAEEQTQGIGRRSRTWRSAAAGNLYVSLVYAPSPPPASVAALGLTLMHLNFALAVGIAVSVRALTGAEARVKWPNDVWIGRAKLAGCLVNCDGKHGGVAGFGINVLEPLSQVEGVTAISLADAAPARVAATPQLREVLLARVLLETERLMSLPWEQLLAEYVQHDMLVGHVVRVHHRSREEAAPQDFDARVLGFAPDGALAVARIPCGTKSNLNSEEVSLSPRE